MGSPEHRGAKWLRTLALVFLVLAVAGCACFFRRGGSPGAACDNFSNQYAATIAATKTPDPGFLRVPMVIHFMSDPAEPNQPPEVKWPPVMIETYFGRGPLSINAAWQPANIHFSVTRVERCVYTPPPDTFRLLASGTKAVYPPDPSVTSSFTLAKQQAIIDHYLQLNVDYGCCRTLNVYIWRAIDQANGYGESPWRNRPEVQARHLTALPTVWFESGLPCGGTVGDTCQRGLAHEIGHALGLHHTCDACTCCVTSTTSGAGCACDPATGTAGATNECGEALACCDGTQADLKRLMFPGTPAFVASGMALCTGEINRARSAVQSFF